MWKTGHYQFFPLVVAVIAWFWYQMSDDLRSRATKPERTVQTFAILGNLALVCVATILNSSFIGAISMVFLFSVTLYSVYGRTGLKRGLPLVFLSLFTIPMPARLDSSLVFQLQFVASALGSWILDALQQTHFREGVVLQTETRGFLTEEACSGIRSLFSSLAGIAVYGVAMGRRWWRHLFNLGQTVFWVVIGNAFRVAVVVYVSENYSDRIASGWPHELLGLIVFVFIFLLAISTDRLLGAFVSEPVDELGYHDQDLALTSIGRSKDGQSAEIAGVSHEEPSQTLTPDAVGISSRLVWVAVPLFCAIFLFGIRLTYVHSKLNKGIASYSDHRLPFPKESDLPREIGEWRLTSFNHTNRGKDKLQAEDSFIWTFRKGNLTALVSVDCPWDVWHDLSNCYSGLGWNIHPSHFFPGGDHLESNPEINGARFSQLGMSKTGGETGVVLFSSMDANGAIVSPQFSSGFFSFDSVRQQLVSNFASTMGLSVDRAAGWKGHKLPLSTLQLYCTPESGISPTEIDELRTLFVNVREHLKESKRFNQP